MTKQLNTLKKGGSFLIEETTAEAVFTPEDFSEEQTMIRDMTEQFVEDEVLPQVEKIEHKDWDVTIKLLKRCGELGLLGIEVPEKYGGENLDKVSAMIVAEKMARVASFAVSYGGRSEEHTSELQSRRDLVCRLLLEKKKKKYKNHKKRKKKKKKKQ